jgi:hypothetical protein
MLVVLMSVTVFGQTRKKEGNSTLFGIKAGANYSKVTAIDRVLVSESYYTGYTFNTKYAWGATAGLYINYKLEGSISAIYSEISYNRLGSTLEYSDINAFEYNIDLRYDLITWELCYKAYITPWLPLSIGPRLGFNTSPDALFYSSNGQAIYGPDIRVQQDMRDVLKGKSEFSIGVGFGIELTNGISFDLRYYHGLSDVMETYVNNYNFIEVKNASRGFQVKLGYVIPYDMKFH